MVKKWSNIERFDIKKQWEGNKIIQDSRDYLFEYFGKSAN